MLTVELGSLYALLHWPLQKLGEVASIPTKVIELELVMETGLDQFC